MPNLLDGKVNEESIDSAMISGRIGSKLEQIDVSRSLSQLNFRSCSPLSSRRDHPPGISP